MASLRELLAAHDSLLLVDAASAIIQVGWLEHQPNTRAGFSARWESRAEEAGIGLFHALESLKAKPSDAGALVFCDGPGSILGIRTTAVALRSWQVLHPRPAFAFHSLDLVAHALGRDDIIVIADARRDSWHAVSLDRKLRRVPTAELTGDLVMPENFRHWSQLPPGVRLTSYALNELLPRTLDADLFRATTAPDAFLHEEPSYVTWTPQIHRAP